MVAIVGTLGSAVAMGTTDETLPFSTQTMLCEAQYNDIRPLVVCGYLAFSLPMSIYHVTRIKAAKTRALLIFSDSIMLGVLAAGASAAASMAYLAHKGNASANWSAICQQYRNFCERITGSLVGSFAAVVLLVLLITSSAATLSIR